MTARTPDEEIAAAYASGLSLIATAAEFGIGRNAARGAVMRAGTPFRRRGRPAAYPWEPEAAARHQAGEAVSRLAREYGTGWRAMKGAIERQGVTIALSRPGRPKGSAG